jgi:hypothetical protein
MLWVSHPEADLSRFRGMINTPRRAAKFLAVDIGNTARLSARIFIVSKPAPRGHPAGGFLRPAGYGLIHPAETKFNARTLGEGMTENARMLAWRPEKKMGDLLRAVVLPDDRWREAWIRWRQSADLERLPPGAFRLLPLLFHRLRSGKISDPWMGKLQGIYRYTWARNQILLRDAAQAARTLRENGIPVMLLKGAAMILSQYRDAGLCPSVDVDILVPDTDIRAAVRSLRGAGFSATGRYEGDLPERFIRIGFSHPFRSPQGNEIDLHWHLLYFRSFAGADESFWRHAVRREFSGLPVFLPSPTDMLLHTCLHGLYWSDTSNLRWVADASRLVQTGSIDWARLAGYAEWPGAALPLRLSLEYLGKEIPIPEETLAVIRSAPVAHGDRWVVMMYAGKENLLWNTLSLWFRHSRFSRAKPVGILPLLAGLPAFLAAYWALPSVWSVPAVALRKILRRFLPQPPATHGFHAPDQLKRSR